MNMKSYFFDDVISAYCIGLSVFRLDTGTDGEDDILIGVNEEEIRKDILHHYDFSKIPQHWELEELLEDTFRERYGER